MGGGRLRSGRRACRACCPLVIGGLGGKGGWMGGGWGELG